MNLYIRFASMLIGLLLIVSAVTANTVLTPEKAIIAGDADSAAHFIVEVRNNDTVKHDITLYVDTGLTYSISERNFRLSERARKSVSIWVPTAGLSKGLHDIALRAYNGEETERLQLVLSMGEGSKGLAIDAITTRLTVRQGEFQDIRVLVRNLGDTEIRNIVIDGDIPTTFNPNYPPILNLEPGEVKDLSIRVGVPVDYPNGDRDLTVSVASGNVRDEAKVKFFVREGYPYMDFVSMKVLYMEPVKDEGGNVVSYAMKVRLSNSAGTDVNGVIFSLHELPEGWTIEDNNAFDIKAFQSYERTLIVMPTDFSEHTTNLVLVKGTEEIASEKVLFAGYKVGKYGSDITGLLFGGSSSLMAGFLIFVILLLVLLYIRQRNEFSDQMEMEDTRKKLEESVGGDDSMAYLKKLAEGTPAGNGGPFKVDFSKAEPIHIPIRIQPIVDSVRHMPPRENAREEPRLDARGAAKPDPWQKAQEFGAQASVEKTEPRQTEKKTDSGQVKGGKLTLEDWIDRSAPKFPARPKPAEPKVITPKVVTRKAAPKPKKKGPRKEYSRGIPVGPDTVVVETTVKD